MTEDVTVWASQSVITSGELAVGGELLHKTEVNSILIVQRWLEFDVYEDILLICNCLC